MAFGLFTAPTIQDTSVRSILLRPIIIQIIEIIEIIFPQVLTSAMSKQSAKQKKGVAWYIPSSLRHWLNSHAEYESAIGKEISTDEMVVNWLTERVKIEEGKRDPRQLERALAAEQRDKENKSLQK